MADKEVKLIDAELLTTNIAQIAKACAKSDKQKALVGRILFMIENMPTIEAETVKHGHWVKGHCGVNEYIKCSVCRTRIVNTIVSLEGDAAEDYFDLCPKCGARLDDDEPPKGE